MGKKVLILGGGPCGLSAAWELSKSGCDVTVLEKESRVGGLCVTNEYKGYRFDLGGHRFISRDSELIAKVCKMMGGELLLSKRKSVILFKGKSYQYPLSARDVFFKLGLWTNLKALTTYTRAAFKNLILEEEDVSFEDWVVSRFGRTLYNIFFGPYTEKLWGISPKFISSDWASQRISLISLKDVFFRIFKLRRDTPRTYAQWFYYPKHGIGQMFEMMADDIVKNGGKILLNANVTGLDIHDNTVRGVCYRRNGVYMQMECDIVISTIPLPDLVKAFPVYLTKDILWHTEALRFRAVRFLNILVDLPDISENTWMYVSGKKYVMTRIQEPKRRSPLSAPEGKTSIMLEIPCNENDDIWNCSPERLLERCVTDLKELGMNIQERIIDYFTTRVTHGYPVYTLDYRNHRLELFRFLDAYKNLISCGRQGAFRYIFMDTAMEMGIAAARSGMVKDACKKEDIRLFCPDEALVEASCITG